MDIRQRILKYLDNKGISKYKFYQDIGVSNGFLDKNGTIGADKCEKICSYYSDLDLIWLITGKGEMLKTESKISIQQSNDEKAIPLVYTEAVAGFGGVGFSIEKQDIQALYHVPDFNGIDFMIRVKGNSMYPKYSSGDIVACRILTDSKFIEWNKPHLIATTEHGLIVKRLRKSEQENCLKAVSDNKDYEPFEIPKDEITGIAIIIGVIRLE